MRKLTFAFAVLASIGGAALIQPASAAPGLPSGISAPDSVTQVRMHPMERRMMHRRMHRRMMHRRMHHRGMHRM
ncbi:hypothetical protein [Methylobacterium pseudosasicola]|uniref:Pentapeptide MXKDX repeat protein n=1 Tax=Methylobacterium pseudosasicola TaxID=582667 RepID=A0A1I4GR37_9HYPH|nr:hypothetical protein [Methylobacterium pseudosasicola]SFL31837.1 hypothetical protein SAMN05192568_1003145 [Methylobacterium pseudosasicola]